MGEGAIALHRVDVKTSKALTPVCRTPCGHRSPSTFAADKDEELMREEITLTHTLPNGLRMVHLPTDSEVAYCGLAVDAGTRDEAPDESGLAHFVEHMLFKGTRRRRAWHILNRMEAVGGDLDAYTTKEETFLYSVFPAPHFERAVELIADLAAHAQFPAAEIEKEREVILDEIRSYEDAPAELIFDEYESMLFDGHPLGRPILGNKRALRRFDTLRGRSFMERYYTAANMVFFSMGATAFQRIVRMAERHFADLPAVGIPHQRTSPAEVSPRESVSRKRTHQSHVILGARACDLFDTRHAPLYLLNNILGGPGMNSRLNVALRERRGLVYGVESNLTCYTDAGLCTIYFGTDPRNRKQALDLVRAELARLRERPLSPTQLAAAKKQAIGQLRVAGDNREGLFLTLGKSFLRFGRCDTPAETARRIEEVTADEILAVANDFLAPDRLSCLVYE